MLAAVVFGRVVEGLHVVQRMEAMGSKSGKPKQPVVIADSGQVREQSVTYGLVVYGQQ